MPREKNNFNSWDKDQNKKLDREELGDWIMPKGYNPALAEAKHLIHAADTDEVGFPVLQSVGEVTLRYKIRSGVGLV